MKNYSSTDYWVSPVTSSNDTMQELKVHKKSEDDIIGTILIEKIDEKYMIKVSRDDLSEPVTMSVTESSKKIGIELKIVVNKLIMA